MRYVRPLETFIEDAYQRAVSATLSELSAKFWMAVLTDLRNRGVKDTFFVVCDRPETLDVLFGRRRS